MLVILGPTASGKTSLAIKLAQKFEGEIVSADSRQIYKEVNLGTAKPTSSELKKAKHHLISEFSPKKTVTVAQYRKLAEEKIRDVLRRKKIPILAGSHTLLISALVENYQFPGKLKTESKRAQLEKTYNSANGPKKLWQQLQKINPEAAEKIPPQNKHHLIRALERSKNQKPTTGKRKFNTLILGLNPPRAELYKKINQRVDEMMRSGLLKEVQRLTKKYDRYSPALRGHGYRELLDYLNGEKSLEQAIEEIKKDTRHYAKRQMTWWRNSPLAKEIIWL